MKTKLISCWFKTSYADYSNSLRLALARELGTEVGVIASNCGCNDPMDGVFFDQSADYFEMPHMKYWNSANPVKRWIRNQGRQMLYRERAKRYLERSEDADVLHFQQTLNGYGSNVVFNWLEMPSEAAKVVTVHELDPYQQDYPQANLTYNRADQIIVHADELASEMAALGVDRSRITLVEHGADITPESQEVREGIVFYAGHKINPGKGLETLTDALLVVRQKLGPATPRLKIHGYYGEDTREYGLEIIRQSGVEDLVVWLDRIDVADVVREYRRSLLAVLPFSGSFAGFAVANAMANGVVVIGTRHAGIPEHLGDTGVIVEPDDPEALASQILDLLANEERRREITARARARAAQLLSWDAVAKKTVQCYEAALRRKGQGFKTAA